MKFFHYEELALYLNLSFYHNKNYKNMAPTSYFLRKPKIRGRICANSKYVLKFDLGLGCIKYTDDKNAKAKVDLMDGMGWQYICRCPSWKRIIYILYTLPGWHNMLLHTHGKEQQPSDCPKVGAVGVRTN